MTTFTNYYAGANHYDFEELFNQGANTEIDYFHAAPHAVQSFLYEQYNMRAVVVRHYGTRQFLTLVWYLDGLCDYAYCVGITNVIPEKFETLRRILYLQEQANMELVEQAGMEIEITELPIDDDNDKYTLDNDGNLIAV